VTDETAPTNTLRLRFVGTEEDGQPLHELRAAHVAEVLQGIVGLSSDFAKAGAFGDGPAGSEVLVRPAQEGSFVIEVLREVLDATESVHDAAAVVGAPGLATIVWYATKSARAEVSDFEYLENGNVKVSWQDDTVDEIPAAVWIELNKRKRRRKKHLRQLMAPLSDERVTNLEVKAPPVVDAPADDHPTFTLAREDYDSVRDEDEIEENARIFETEASMSAIDFDDARKWRVRTPEQNKTATMEDADFLQKVATGLAIRSSDIFRLRVREDTVTKNGRRRAKWTVLQVVNHRRAVHDDDDS